jgi:RNA polymerase sigma-70 factor (ECF subfamily)
MVPPSRIESASAEPIHVFQTTQWSVVQSAGEVTSPEAQAALARLCQAYWLPIYAFIRKRGHSPEQAEDLVQDFFGGFLEKNYVAKAVRERGRFRSFLMSSVENFLHNVHARNQAQKRGGGIPLLSLNVQDAEACYLAEPTDETDPAKAFEQRWASTVLHTVLQRLRQEFVESGRSELFEALHAHLWGDDECVPYPQLATDFNLSVANVKTTAHRLRRRYQQLLREEIAQTISQPGEIDEEIRYLMMVVSR